MKSIPRNYLRYNFQIFLFLPPSIPILPSCVTPIYEPATKLVPKMEKKKNQFQHTPLIFILN